MSALDLVSDCNRCAALCCVTLAFDKGPDFAADKPAGQGCAHLGPEFRCQIHEARAERGYSGCLRFDCLGAGQRTTALFANSDWRDNPAVMPAMIDTFSVLREVHRLFELLVAAGGLPLPPAQQIERRALMDALHPEMPWTLEQVRELDISALSDHVSSYVAGLRVLVQATQMPGNT